MAIYKQTKIVFFLFLFSLSACHVVTQDDLTGVGLAPDPVFNNNRTLVVTPISLPQGDKRSSYIWLGTEIETMVFNYLQFINSVPGDIRNVIVDNGQDIWDFYGISKPNKDKQVEMLEKTIKDNKDHWQSITPENNQKMSKFYTIPSELNTNVLQGKDSTVSYLDKNYMVAQLTLDGHKSLKLSIYDPVSVKTLVNWEIPISKGVEKGDDPEQKVVLELLKKKLYETIKTITHKEIAEIKIPVLTGDMSVFLDGKIILTPSVFVTKGVHQVYISQLGDIIQGGKIDVQKDGELDIENAIKNQKGQKLILKTKPDNTPIFIDEKYVGLSPVEIKLPEGVHYIRASTLGYSHLNYILKVEPYKPIKDLSLDLSLNDQAYLNRVKMLRQLKLGTFYSGVLSLGAFLVAYERGAFYENKFNRNVDIEMSRKRYNQFQVAQFVFGGVGGSLILVALIAQIMEYQARDVGIGVNEDGNLGVSYRF